MNTGATIARMACAAAAIALVIVLAVSAKPWDADAIPGPSSKPADFLAWYGWWAGLVNALLLAILAAIAGFWAAATSIAGVWLPPAATPRWFWPGVACAVLLLAGFAAPRLGQSLWDDEENSVRRLIAGKLVSDGEGGLRLRKAGWEQAFWSYNRATNHHLQTWTSKACHEIWKVFGPHAPPHFREWVVRLPSFAAGLLSLVALAALLKRLGFPGAGVLAGLLLATHPWFIRYASEARGYALTVLFSILALRCAIEGIGCNRWRWWAGYGLALLGMLAAFPATAVVAAPLSIAVAAALLWRHGWPAFPRHAARWFVASALAAMAFLQMMLPCAPQMDTQVHDALASAMNPRWERNLGSFFLAGMPWSNSDDPTAGFPELRWVAEGSPWFFRLVAWAAGGLALLGIVRMFLRRPAGWICAAVWLAAPVLLLLTAKAAGLYLYEWYFLFALPGAVAFVAVGLSGLAACTGRRWRPAGVLVAALGLAPVLALQSRARERLVTLPLQGMREAVLTMRGGLDPSASPGILTGQVAVRLELYDPRVRHLRSADELLALAREADRLGWPLLITAGNPWAVAASSPDLAGMLDDARLFERVAVFQGFDPTLDQKVFRYRPGSVESVQQKPVHGDSETVPHPP